LGGAAFGQTFEVADVHVNSPTPLPYLQTGYTRGRFEARNGTMVDLVALAWGIPNRVEKVVGTDQ
jgi:hypothetical protein